MTVIFPTSDIVSDEFGQRRILVDNSTLGDQGVSASGFARVSQGATVFSGRTVRDKQPLSFVEQTTGSGASTFNANQASVTLSTTLAGDRVVRQSRFYAPYQDGNGQRIAITASFGGGTIGVKKKAGLFDDDNGIFFQLNGLTPEFIVRTLTSGTPAETAVAQAAWSIDKMDGTGASGIALDFTKAQQIVVDYEWSGVGRARVGFRVGGSVHYVHTFDTANVNALVYMSTPSLPARWEIEAGTGTASSMDAIAVDVKSEGGAVGPGISRSFTAQTAVAVPLLNNAPLLSVRLKSADVRAAVSITRARAASTGGADFFMWAVLNPTFTGGAAPTWANAQADSAVEIDTARNGIWNNDGHVLASSMANDVTRAHTLDNFSHQIGASVAGVSDVIVIIAKTVEANNPDLYTTVDWQEVA